MIELKCVKCGKVVSVDEKEKETQTKESFIDVMLKLGFEFTCQACLCEESGAIA